MALFREQETKGSEMIKDEGRRRLTLDAIAQRHLTDDELQQDAEGKAEALGRLRRLRLDHMQLGELDALECMGRITHLFLHHNLLREVDDVVLLPHLRFLSLAHNRIERVPDLRWDHVNSKARWLYASLSL
jgi:Leucine-rich repeat (LRR) protein